MINILKLQNITIAHLDLVSEIAIFLKKTENYGISLLTLSLLLVLIIQPEEIVYFVNYLDHLFPDRGYD